MKWWNLSLRKHHCEHFRCVNHKKKNKYSVLFCFIHYFLVFFCRVFNVNSHKMVFVWFVPDESVFVIESLFRERNVNIRTPSTRRNGQSCVDFTCPATALSATVPSCMKTSRVNSTTRVLRVSLTRTVATHTHRSVMTCEMSLWRWVNILILYMSVLPSLQHKCHTVF